MQRITSSLDQNPVFFMEFLGIQIVKIFLNFPVDVPRSVNDDDGVNNV